MGLAVRRLFNKEKASEHGVGDSTEHGHMTVTALKMVSEGYKRGRNSLTADAPLISFQVFPVRDHAATC
jgi:hypothetical protein